MRYLSIAFALLSSPLIAQTYNTSCVLYPSAAYCTTSTSDGGTAMASAERQQQYDAGYAVGRNVGMGIARKMFPGWRRKYCSQHPEQPFYYNEEISGSCPTLEHLAYEAAYEFRAKHGDQIKSAEHAQAIVTYIQTNNLPDWEPKSYQKAAKATDPAKQATKKKAKT